MSDEDTTSIDEWGTFYGFEAIKDAGTVFTGPMTRDRYKQLITHELTNSVANDGGQDKLDAMIESAVKYVDDFYRARDIELED